MKEYCIGLNYPEMASGTIEPHPHATPQSINYTPDHIHYNTNSLNHCLLFTERMTLLGFYLELQKSGACADFF